jgi:hypothetical protein
MGLDGRNRCGRVILRLLASRAGFQREEGGEAHRRPLTSTGALQAGSGGGATMAKVRVAMPMRTEADGAVIESPVLVCRTRRRRGGHARSRPGVSREASCAMA